jgi:hypothetical protein
VCTTKGRKETRCGKKVKSRLYPWKLSFSGRKISGSLLRNCLEDAAAMELENLLIFAYFICGSGTFSS